MVGSSYALRVGWMIHDTKHAFYQLFYVSAPKQQKLGAFVYRNGLNYRNGLLYVTLSACNAFLIEATGSRKYEQHAF